MVIRELRDISSFRYWRAITVLWGCYFVSGSLGLNLGVAERAVTLVWLPTGLSIVAVMILGWRVWPAIALGAFSVNIFNDLPVITSTLIMIGNTLEALVTVYFFKFFCTDKYFSTMYSSLSFVVACILGSVISPTIGCFALWLNGMETTSSVMHTWGVWLLGDLISGLLLCPLIYFIIGGFYSKDTLFKRSSTDAWLWQHILLISITAVCSYVFYWGLASKDFTLSFMYLPGVMVLLGAVRFSPLVAISQCFLIGVIGVTGFINSGLAFNQGEITYEMFFLYGWLVVLSIVALWLSSAVQEWNAISVDLEEAKKEALEASQQKSQFLANMSHEIRTPLNGIIGMASLMMVEDQEKRNREKIRLIQSSADSLLHLLDDALDHARIIAGKFSIEPRPFDLHQLANDIFSLFLPIAESKNIKMQICIEDNVPVYVYADDSRIRQIITNLVSNALKFTKAGSIKLEIGWKQEGCGVFRITDTGIGIPEEALENVFAPFTQADSSTSREYGGSGLGLTICKLLVDEMNGEMILQAQAGQGTKVTVSVPMEYATENQVRLAQNPESPIDFPVTEEGASGKTILIVEDNLTNTIVTRKMLEKFGHEVILARNGEEGVKCWSEQLQKNEPVDLILMDCHMPLMDGYQATATIREKEHVEGLVPIPIIALTADAQKSERQHCLDVGMNDYLSKPIRIEVLRQCLNQFFLIN